MTPRPEHYTTVGQRIADHATGAIDIARDLSARTDLPASARSQFRAIAALLQGVPLDALAMQSLIGGLEEDLRGVLGSNCRIAQENTRLLRLVPSDDVSVA